MELVDLQEGETLQECARRVFGKSAYVPVSRFDSPEAPLLGYIDANGEVYAVVEQGDLTDG